MPHLFQQYHAGGLAGAARPGLQAADNIVKRAGGPEALRANPDMVPQVHIRGDQNAPWRCVAGAIYNVQISGYPTVGFISNPGRSRRLIRPAQAGPVQE
jgi:hypothetical protein